MAKRRRATRRRVLQDGEDEFYTSFAVEPGMAQRTSEYSGSGAGHGMSSASPDLSTVDLGHTAPMDAHAEYLPSNLGYNHPSTSAYRGLASVPERASEYSDDSTLLANSQPTQLYFIPPPGGGVPPVSNQNKVNRTSADSFFGAI